MEFHNWLKGLWTNVLSWFGVEEQKLSSFLYPIYKDAKVLLKKDLLDAIIDGVPVVTAAITGAAPAEMLAAGLKAAEDYILPLLEKEGLALAKTTIGALSNGLVAQAQQAISAVSAGTTPTPTPTPTSAEVA